MEKVLEFNKKIEDTMEWFFKLLDEEKIPHEEEIKEEWGGSARRPKYEQNVIVYVPKEYKEKVESYLKEYNNPNNIVYEDAEELRNISSDEEEEYKLTNISKKVIKGVLVGMMIILTIGIIISSMQ